MKAFHFLATDRNSQQHNKNLQKNSNVTTTECRKKRCSCAFLNTPAHTDGKLPPGAWVEKKKKKEKHLLKVSFKCFRI